MKFAPLLAVFLLAPPSSAQTTERISLATSGAEGDLDSSHCALSADGRYVAFESRAATLVPGDTNGTADIFVRDRLNGTTERVSVDSNGIQGDWYSLAPSISADGRFVAFESRAANLVAGDTNGKKDIFVRDRLLGTTRRVSVDASGLQADGDSQEAALSADGRFVACASLAGNLVPGDTNGLRDVYVFELASGRVERASLPASGAQPNQHLFNPSLSADGRCVAFAGMASNLVSGDVGGFSDVFVRDRLLGTIELASVGSSGIQAQGASFLPALSADGRWVAFESEAINLDPNDTNQISDAYVHDRQSGATVRLSAAPGGGPADSFSRAPSISGDGRWIAFESSATNLAGPDANLWQDIYVCDRLAGTLVLASVDSSGAQCHGQSGGARLSADGSTLAYSSLAADLVAGDGNGQRDVFAHGLGSSIPGTDLCQPGQAGVLDCPCGNPPANAPRGCDNSSGTGGAQLVSSGTASLAFDSLVFATNGEKPSATSILLQGSAGLANGAAFGQGVRCLGGTLKRLYVESASAGSIRVPPAGAPSVSARSAALGDALSAGSQRWYAAYYRDPLVLGGCPAASTFNLTQTQLVLWGS